MTAELSNKKKEEEEKHFLQNFKNIKIMTIFRSDNEHKYKNKMLTNLNSFSIKFK